MKKLLCVLCAVLLAAGGCGQVADMSNVNEIAGPGAWNVSIEQIDLGKPENKQYADWREQQINERNKEPDDPWNRVWLDEEKKRIKEVSQPWTDTAELVIQYRYPEDGHPVRIDELFVRNKITGEAQLIAERKQYDTEGYGGVLNVREILDDTHFLYEYYGVEGLEDPCFMYDITTGESIRVELSQQNVDGAIVWIQGNQLHQITDIVGFYSGEENDWPVIAHWDFGDDLYSAWCSAFSHDKRFVHMDFVLVSDWHQFYRGIFDMDSTEMVAFFPLPKPLPKESLPMQANSVLVSDTLAYFYYLSYYVDDERQPFYLIHYGP